MASPGIGHTVRDNVRADLMWYVRHAQVLERWPVIGEPWAQRLEARRRAIAAERTRNAVYLHGVGR